MLDTWTIAWREANSLLHQRRMLLFAIGFGIILPLIAGGIFVGIAVRLSSVVGVGSVGQLRATIHVSQLQGLVESLLVWLGIFPVLFSAQFAAIAIAAERERRSLPALLATPVSVTSILVGKLLASLLPGVVTVTAAYVVYVVSADLAAPEASAWLPLPTCAAAYCFIIALAVLVNGCALLISAYSKTIVAASSTVTFISLPVSVATVVFAVTISSLGSGAVFVIALAMACLAGGVIAGGSAIWKRGEILAN